VGLLGLCSNESSGIGAESFLEVSRSQFAMCVLIGLFDLLTCRRVVHESGDVGDNALHARMLSIASGGVNAASSLVKGAAAGIGREAVSRLKLVGRIEGNEYELRDDGIDLDVVEGVTSEMEFVSWCWYALHFLL
jgi:hypothetical protein